MKTLLLLSLVAALPGFLSGCTTNAATGKQTLNPEFHTVFNRIGLTALTAAEVAINAKIARELRVEASGK